MDEIELLLANRAIINRGSYQAAQVNRQKASDRAQEANAAILGYDPVIGQYKVKKPSGDISSSRAISNSAGLSKGSIVSLTTPTAGSPTIDTMPRG